MTSKIKQLQLGEGFEIEEDFDFFDITDAEDVALEDIKEGDIIFAVFFRGGKWIGKAKFNSELPEECVNKMSFGSETMLCPLEAGEGYKRLN